MGLKKCVFMVLSVLNDIPVIVWQQERRLFDGAFCWNYLSLSARN